MRSILLRGLLGGLLAYAFDQLVLPKELTKSFREKLGLFGTIGKYAAIAGATMLATSASLPSSSAPRGRARDGALSPDEFSLDDERAIRTTLPWGTVVVGRA